MLIEALDSRKTDQQIADLLNVKGLLSPSGKQWSPTAVKQALFKLRHFRDIPNRLHTALLQLVFDGKLPPTKVEILFRERKAANVL